MFKILYIYIKIINIERKIWEYLNVYYIIYVIRCICNIELIANRLVSGLTFDTYTRKMFKGFLPLGLLNPEKPRSQGQIILVITLNNK